MLQHGAVGKEAVEFHIGASGGWGAGHPGSDGDGEEGSA